MKIKIWEKIVFVMVVVGMSVVAFTGSVFANDSGTGSTGGEATATTCTGEGSATHIKNTDQCSDDYGGASWHIFSVKYPPVLNNNLDRVQPSHLGPTYNTNEKFMKDGGYDWAFSCPASRYDYYLAYVYDGWNGKNLSNGPVWYGPLQWQVACGEIGDHCNHPVYHTRKAYSYNDGVASMRNGNANTLRITGSHPDKASDASYVSADALAFYRKYCYATGKCSADASSIPAIGYFCIPKTMAYTPYSASSTIDIKVNGSDGPIYVKPGDDLVFKTSYNPAAQAGYNVEAQSINVDGEGIKPGGYTDFASLRTLFSWYSGRGNWGNTFTVSKNFSNEVLTYNGTVGSTVAFNDGNGNSHRVRNTDVGESSPVETAALTKNTPGYVYSRSYYDAYVLADIDTRLSDKAMAAVPYNFNNNVEITTPVKNADESLNVAYAGESKEFAFDITTGLRKNNVVGATYATIVRNAHTRLKICYNGECHYSEPKKISDLHVNEDIYSESKVSDSTTINIPDVSAGSEVCVQAGIYPRDSHDDKNIKMDAYNISDNNSWKYSEPRCYTVAKRPSIQAWGGNVYSRGNLITATAVKNNLAGYAQYNYNVNVKNGKGPFVFGSWGELGVVGNGVISGFGSGASMGYAINNGDGTTWPSYNPLNGLGNNAVTIGEPGGSGKASFCDRVPLTIPNTPCDESGVKGLSSAVGITKVVSDKESIVNLLASGERVINPFGGEVNTSIIGATMDGGTVRAVSTDGDIKINSDLIYLNESYLSYEQMPKLVIYAKKKTDGSGGNININCDVDRIDALLIADNTVNTCADSDDVNSSANANQLFVNGAIIAKRLVANRTYGAATGANSIVPAEVINFDPTLYQFGGSAEADDDTTGRLDVTYMHELPPRL